MIDGPFLKEISWAMPGSVALAKTTTTGIAKVNLSSTQNESKGDNTLFGEGETYQRHKMGSGGIGFRPIRGCRGVPEACWTLDASFGIQGRLTCQANFQWARHSSPLATSRSVTLAVALGPWLGSA